MAEKDRLTSEIYAGLRAFSEDSFPKICQRCERRFESVSHFLQETRGLQKGTGLRENLDDNDRTVVELFRNCPCGSTLMELFGDRRDMSEAGIHRREKFRSLMNMLIAEGIPAEVARTELLRVLRGEDSQILREHGIDPDQP